MTQTIRGHVFDIPMRVRFRGQEHRLGMVIEGAAGWGEFSPFPDYDAATCARWLAAAREAAELGWPAPLRTTVAVNTTVPAVGPEQAHAMVAASGCSTAKVKVAETGQTLADDIARVEAVRDALGPSGALRIDANAAWDVDRAAHALTELSRFDLEYAEQPVPHLEDMAALRRRVDVRLAADESIRTAEDPLRVAGLDAADVVVLKVQPLGGVRVCLAVAEACGLPVVVSSAVETSVGIAAGLALAAALPDLPFACGLGTIPLLAGDICDDSLVPVDGSIAVRRVAPSSDMLAKYATDDGQIAWWNGRFAAAGEVLDAS
ncbi:MAG TPA: o-succinylbenzoate synthase [Mycobacteriales bacterium]|nr:o-succinylbenzoate synthase [Mycobacteriales bacterium]